MVLAISHGAGIGSLPTLVESLGLGLVMLNLEPVAHPVLWLRHHPAATRQGRVQRVKEWIQRAFDPVDKPWFRDEYIHPKDFDRALKKVASVTHHDVRWVSTRWIFAMLMFRGDIYLVTLLGGGLASAGVYSIAVFAAEIALKIPQWSAAVLTPIVASDASRGRRNGYRRRSAAPEHGPR